MATFDHLVLGNPNEHKTRNHNIVYFFLKSNCSRWYFEACGVRTQFVMICRVGIFWFEAEISCEEGCAAGDDTPCFRKLIDNNDLLELARNIQQNPVLCLSSIRNYYVSWILQTAIQENNSIVMKGNPRSNIVQSIRNYIFIIRSLFISQIKFYSLVIVLTTESKSVFLI